MKMRIWYKGSGIRRFGCTCDRNDDPGDICNGDMLRCEGAIQAHPTWQRICEDHRDVREADAKRIMEIIEGTRDFREEPEAETIGMFHACLLTKDEYAIYVIDKILNTFGVAGYKLEACGDGEDKYVSYCKTGRMYNRTVIYFEGAYYLASEEDIRNTANSIQEDQRCVEQVD